MCSAHAVAKAVVALLDDSGCDPLPHQEVITWILINHKFLPLNAAFPDVCDKLVFAAEIKNKETEKKSQLQFGTKYIQRNSK